VSAWRGSLQLPREWHCAAELTALEWNSLEEGGWHGMDGINYEFIVFEKITENE
jgi:hypothetical protein